jgi:imidazole glycerol-phosphate synthase subunit HisF
MLTKRIIACLDVKNGRTVKGTNFIDLKDMGDPVELAAYYTEQGIDELVFLDISATNEKRKALSALVKKTASVLNIPFTVGGGIASIEDVSVLLEAGADKISVNTAAFNHPELIDQIAKQFGSQCMVVAIDTKFENGEWFVYLNGGSRATNMRAEIWAKKAESLGAGEILLTSINNDGKRNGFAIDIISRISSTLQIPVIASGGAGRMEHFADIFENGKADAALAAGIFHERIVMVSELKKYLSSKNIPVRI